jgi:hypothetical protein
MRTLNSIELKAVSGGRGGGGAGGDRGQGTSSSATNNNNNNNNTGVTGSKNPGGGPATAVPVTRTAPVSAAVAWVPAELNSLR